MLSIIIPSISTIICTILAGWFALEQSKEKKSQVREQQRQAEEREGQLLQYAIQRRSAELTKCIALNTVNPNAHICDIKDAMVKLDEACEAYDEFLERLRVSHMI